MILPIGPWYVRSWREADVDSIAHYANNLRVSRTLRDKFPYPYTRAHAIEWVQRVLQQNPETHFAIASEHEAIGGIGLELQEDERRMSAELGYWLGEPFWGQGIVTRAVRALTDFGFEHFTLNRIYAYVYETNPASARVLEKAGFLREGTLRNGVVKEGRPLNVGLYAVVRSLPIE